jgi:hypothetical protein
MRQTTIRQGQMKGGSIEFSITQSIPEFRRAESQNHRVQAEVVHQYVGRDGKIYFTVLNPARPMERNFL